MKYETQRREIVAACLDMNRRGINQGTSGNISARVKEGFLITPSGMPYDEMKPADIVLMRPDGSHSGRRKPSSEWRFHTQHHGEAAGGRRGSSIPIRCSRPPSSSSAWRFRPCIT